MKRYLSILSAATAVIIMTSDPSEATRRIRFDDFYIGETYQAGVGLRPNIQISAKMENLNGQPVEIFGFMDGILPRDGSYFVLIKEPSFQCPFHTVSFDWAGFIPVFLAGSTDYIDGAVRVTGRLEVGAKEDETGMLSYIRIYDAKVQRAQ